MLQPGLIVSCRAREGNRLRGPTFMAAMALAVEQGGAVGLRPNDLHDILAIKAVTRLPVIGIFKTAVEGFEVVVTPTLESERWRIESTARDGGVVGQLFWYDRHAGLMVPALAGRRLQERLRNARLRRLWPRRE